MNIAEQQHGTGLREDLHDGRDFPFGAYLESYEDKLGEIILDWNKGYNVEKDLGIVFPVKNQGVSGSCFIRGTKVLMEDLSYKNIEEIQIGDYVITHLGNKKKVTEIKKRLWQGNIYEIKGYGLLPIKCSPEHPFLIDGRDWINAKDLKTGMRLTIPKTSNIIKDKLDYEFEQDGEFLWVLGLFLAEGNFSDYCLQFSLHKKETEYRDRISRFFNQFGVNVTTTYKKGTDSMYVMVYGKKWVDLFREYTGEYCNKKKLNKKFLTLEPKKQLNILKGWMDGDGCYTKETVYVGVTTSKNLVRQMFDIAKRNNIRIAIRKRKLREDRKDCWDLQFSRSEVDKFENKKPIKKNNNYFSEDKNNFYIKIHKINIEHNYTGGNIYNLEVEDDNSYVVEGVAVHNCVGQSVAGYKEFIEYYLKRSTTEKSAKSIYSQIALPQSGAYFRDGMKVACEYGINTEKEVPSYLYSAPGDEAFMQDKKWMNAEMTKLAKRFSNQNFYSLKGYGIDVFAKAIIIGKGAVIGVVGTNNGTWNSTFPAPPAMNTPQGKLWGHALLAVGFLIINGKKYIKVRNSWGTIGENGYQYLGEEWFANYGMFIYNPWVIASKLMFTQKDLKHATAYTIFVKKITEEGSIRTQRQGFCINKEGENRLIIANASIVTKLREDISQKAYKDSKGETFWAFSTPKITIEITNEEYNALKKFDQSWNKLEETI